MDDLLVWNIDLSLYTETQLRELLKVAQNLDQSIGNAIAEYLTINF